MSNDNSSTNSNDPLSSEATELTKDNKKKEVITVFEITSEIENAISDLQTQMKNNDDELMKRLEKIEKELDELK